MAEPPPPKTTIAIIGAGIAGPVLALQILSHPRLAQLYTPIIYDRSPAPSSSGAAVALTSNAIFPLYSLLSKEAVDAISCETERIQIWRSFPYDGAGERPKLGGKYLNQILSPNWQPDLSTSLRVVERGALQRLLLERVKELGGEVRWGMRFLGLEQGQREGGVKIAFEGREVEEVGLVVGADGGWSEVRRGIIASNTPRDGKMDQDQVDRRWKPDFAGADAIYGVSRRIERENGDEGNEQREGDTHWVFLDGGLASTWALAEGKTFWTLTYLSKTPPEKKSGSASKQEEASLYGAPVNLGRCSLEETRAVLEKYEKAWHPTAGTFGNLLKNSERIVRTPLYYRAWEAEEIAGENVVLIGDASRLMLPTSGQGACFSIEDATVLANALLSNPPSPSSSPNSPVDFSAAIASYTSLRISRSKSMTKQSYWMGVIMRWTDTWWLRWFVDLSTSWLPTGADPKLRKGKPKDPMGWIYEQRYKVELRGNEGGESGD